jgi:hypothetical protein
MFVECHSATVTGSGFSIEPKNDQQIHAAVFASSHHDRQSIVCNVHGSRAIVPGDASIRASGFTADAPMFSTHLHCMCTILDMRAQWLSIIMC